MFDGLKRKIAAGALGSVLKSLASDDGTKTTITGIVAGAVIAIPGLDLGLLIAGDPDQVRRLVVGLAVFAIGLLATRERRDGHTTLIGAVAGAAQMTQGSVEAVLSGVVLAVLGYLANKPVGVLPPAGPDK